MELSLLVSVAALLVSIWAIIASNRTARSQTLLQEQLLKLEHARERDRLAEATTASLVAQMYLVDRSARLQITNTGRADFALFAAAAVCAASSWYVDRQLQGFRLADKSPPAYLFVPVRWKRELYKPEGHHLIDKAWSLILAMYGLGFAGMVLIALGS